MMFIGIKSLEQYHISTSCQCTENRVLISCRYVYAFASKKEENTKNNIY